MGSGSTIAAAVACGIEAIGVESNEEYHAMAERSVPLLADLPVTFPSRHAASR